MLRRTWHAGLLASALIGGSGLPALAVAASTPTGGSPPPSPAPDSLPQPEGVELAAAPTRGGSLEMKVRRLPDAVEVVIEGAGEAPQLRQTTEGSTWRGLLVLSGANALRRGPQRLTLPEAGLQSIAIEGSGTTYRLSVTPSPGFPVTRPVVSSDGRDLILSFNAPSQPTLQTAVPNLETPGRVPDPVFVPPLQPRAVAPPVGDMAVGTMMLTNPSFLNLSGPPVTMTLRNAPAKEVLMAISRIGGYGFVYVDEPNGAIPAGGMDPGLRPISISFRNESFSRAVNSALLAAGLQGKTEGNLILAGPNVLGKTFGAQMSKVYRLNQASASSAADYLANLGATINKTFTTTSVTSDIQSAGTAQVGSAQQTSATATTTQIESYGASQGPLRGLIGTTDSRLGTITLVGDPKVVAVAENYLRQLDLRQRQVALAVRILDVDLTNDTELANSFAFRWGNNFIVNDNGELIGAFGRNLPPDGGVFERQIPRNASELGETTGVQVLTNDYLISESLDLNASILQDVNAQLQREVGARLVPFTDPNTFRQSYRVVPEPGTSNRLDSAAISSTLDRLLGRSVSLTRGSSGTSGVRPNPSLNYPRDNFFDLVRATILSRTTKVLASPTLILQENPSLIRGQDSEGGSSEDSTFARSFSDIDAPIGRRRANEGVVRVGTNVPTSVSSTIVGDAGSVTCEIDELTTAGLVLGARVEKIDDNGFVTFSLSPSISAVEREVPSGNDCPPISILRVRRLDTGAVRVRDGQTLILTGVISDADISEVSKWPILGDIPLIGQFFRASGNAREKRELVILVTPRIIDDSEGGTFGYGYTPSSSHSRQFMRSVGN